MLQKGIDVSKYPSHLFISHYHLDHCLDYITLAKDRGLLSKNKGIKNIVNVYGPEGLLDLSQDLFERIKKWDYMSKELDVFDVLKLKETMDGEVVKNESWTVTCSPITHYDGVCYRLDSEGKSIVYSGDMGYDERISQLGKNADIAIMECSYPSEVENKGVHLFPEAIGRLAKLGNFKHVILTHLYPACEGHEEEMTQTIKKIADCNVSVASDFLELTI
jgi:ribonuclease BN (tRNA processing enzyme)